MLNSSATTICVLDLVVRHTTMNRTMGIRFRTKLVSWSILKAEFTEPTIIRKMVPGPITVPNIIRACPRFH